MSSEVTPWPAFDVERTSVRVVLLDSLGQLFLFDTVEPETPELGHWWELPGGGMDPGESIADTAVREIFEETGFVVQPTDVGEPRWRRDTTYVRRRRRTYQHESVVSARLSVPAPIPQAGGRTPEEVAQYVGWKWWDVEELQRSTDRFFPGSLPTLLGGFLSGARIDEPFELWN